MMSGKWELKKGKVSVVDRGMSGGDENGKQRQKTASRR
jgi:hypothetical protein